MGNYHDFKCERCDFTAQCSHGRDRGFKALVQPLYCTKCKVLRNVRIGNYVSDESTDFVTTLRDVVPICRECNESNNLQLWDGMTCPKCGNSPLLMRDSGICWD